MQTALREASENFPAIGGSSLLASLGGWAISAGPAPLGECLRDEHGDEGVAWKRMADVIAGVPVPPPPFRNACIRFC